MVRARLASLAVAAGLGLTCGCSNLSHHSLFGHKECGATSGCACSQGGETVVGDGPILDDGGSGNVEAPNQYGVPPSLVPQNAVPPLGPVPRLVPQPQQSQPVPYNPAKQVH